MILLKIAFRNVKLNWRHSLAAILSIVASFFALIIFEGYMKDLSHLYLDSYRHRAMYGDLLIENINLNSPEAKSEPWKFYLTEEQQKKISSFLEKYTADVLVTVKFLNINGMITNGRTSQIFYGFGHDLIPGSKMRAHWAWNTLYGKPLYLSESDGVEHPIVLGQNLGKILDCVPDKKINSILPNGGYLPEVRPFQCYRNDIQMSLSTEDGQLNAMDFTVSGLVDSAYKEIDSKYIGISLQDAQTLFNTRKISFQTIQLQNPILIDSFVNNFNQEIQNSEPQLHITKWQDHKAGELYRKTLSLLAIFRNFVVIVILSISILSVMNTMVKIIKERTKEVGTLLSLGFLKKQVLLIFILESIFLALIGCVIGAVSSLLWTVILNQMHIFYRAGFLSEPVLFKVMVAPFDYFKTTLLLIGVTALTTFLSIQSTLKKKVIECLTFS